MAFNSLSPIRRTAIQGMSAALLPSARAGAATPASVPASRRSEAERLRSYAETTHPRGGIAAADPVWRSGWDRLAAEVGQAVAAFGDLLQRAIDVRDAAVVDVVQGLVDFKLR